MRLLKDISYYTIRSSSINLNFQASFSISPESIKSVHLTHDSPKQNRCDQVAPYSVFVDSNGDYNNATIPLGSHIVTATPYDQPNCTGKSGTTIVQEYKVSGCATTFQIEDHDARRIVHLSPFVSEKVSSRAIYKHTRLPVILSLGCKVSLSTRAQCGFPFRSIHVELLNVTTNEQIVSKKHTWYWGAASFPLWVDIYMAPGSYSLRAIIDNVIHPRINFTVVNNTRTCII